MYNQSRGNKLIGGISTVEKKRGRPRKDNPKSKILETRVDEAKGEFIAAICEEYGLKESEALRCMIDYLYYSKRSFKNDKKWVNAIRSNKRRAGIVIEESD